MEKGEAKVGKGREGRRERKRRSMQIEGGRGERRGGKRHRKEGGS